MSRQLDQRRAGSQTEAKIATIDQLHEVACHLQRSVRYHRARERFFDTWSNWFSFASLIAGSSVVVALLSALPSWIALASGAAVAAMQALEQVFRLSSKARDHSGLAAEFLALERIMAMREEMPVSELREMKAEILSIEAREPPVKRYLDLICHNQVAKAIGSDDIEKLKFWQRLFAQYLNGDHVTLEGGDRSS
ncbi:MULTISPECIES: hypothetical protein [Ruegeria]|uniref:SMODS and SLOG-associating 2TM effector domain-containing protein n=1 Tax=Ruegeria atlantica TaxID=81569 RepID=A0ABX1WHJ2_9RHOB|nr:MULTISPECIES: hypothetical protein [Ruegeria]NOD32811.1 hypothetical protein [Ruegeria atlantica]